MSKIYNYNDYLIEDEFQSIVEILFRLDESKLDMFNSDFIIKLKKFLEKLPKEKIKDYYIKLVNKVKNLPAPVRKKLLITITSIFLGFVTLNYLSDTFMQTGIKPETIKEISIVKASFHKAQELVKKAEGGYSNDRKDLGNYVNTKKGKRFIGTNHGISAPLLADYMGKIPTIKDMKDLSYNTALKIYKKEYWDKLKLSNLNNQSIANIIYDGCINQGIKNMRSVLRAALEENDININDNDNIFSEEIIDKINSISSEQLFDSIKKHRNKKYEQAGTYKTHGAGWLNRLDSITYNNQS